MKGSRCGSGWVRASSGRTGLRVDATGGAQDGVGCHGHDKRFAMSGETMLVIGKHYKIFISIRSTNPTSHSHGRMKIISQHMLVVQTRCTRCTRHLRE